MAVSYKTWLASNGRKGTAADAMVWKKTHGVALGLYNPDGTAKAATPAAPTGAGPPPPIPLPDLRLPGLQADLQAIPGRFNDQRRGDALDALRSLVSSGLLESGTLGQETVDSGIPIDAANPTAGNQQNVVYKLIPGPGGKMYRQAYMSTVAAQNARGFLESSQTNQQVQEGKAGLDSNVNDALQALLRHSTQSLEDQRQATSGVSGSITGVKQDAAAAAQAAGPPAPPAPVAGALTGPAAPAGGGVMSPYRPPVGVRVPAPRPPASSGIPTRTHPPAPAARPHRLIVPRR